MISQCSGSTIHPTYCKNILLIKTSTNQTSEVVSRKVLGTIRWGTLANMQLKKRVLFRLPAYSYYCIYWHIHWQIVSWLIWKSGQQKKTKKKNTWNAKLQNLQIGFKPHLEVVSNVVPIGFLQMRLSLDAHSDCVTRNATHIHQIQSDGRAEQNTCFY